ncbi:MAG: biopolymer transporter ExbD, partial [Gemmatimonadaceae bacterium]|nr:biopolymer transporter ExbD [Chitinophagaceae bacterium]
LITFFMITTAWSKPTVMKLAMPADGGTPQPESTVITLIPLEENKLFYYEGQPDIALSNGGVGITSFASVRGLIRNSQDRLSRSKKFKRTDLMVVIKPGEGCSYGNIVDLLDEMLIGDVRHHALTELTAVETSAIAKLSRE